MRGTFLILLLVLKFGAVLNAQVTVYHNIREQSLGYFAPSYLVGDRISLRKDSTVNSGLIKSMDIGTEVWLLSRTEHLDTIKGIASPWFRAVAGADTGWVWGGFVAQLTAGSNEYPSVKFLLGFSGLEKITAYGTTYETMHMQIRVVENNKQLDKMLIPLYADYLEAQFQGRKGIKGLNDIIIVHQPCIGGCGCSTGNHYVFWDGQKLRLAYSTLGSADAEYSEGSTIIFPSDMQGETGYIKVIDDIVGSVTEIVSDNEDVEYVDENSIMLRSTVTTYYIWNGKELTRDAQKPKVVVESYYDTENNKYVPKPVKVLNTVEEE
jgi:hypothetical protein